eukprot:scaffold681784_cov59-Prasinocladus_malaysianus.AAC.1
MVIICSKVYPRYDRLLVSAAPAGSMNALEPRTSGNLQGTYLEPCPMSPAVNSGLRPAKVNTSKLLAISPQPSLDALSSAIMLGPVRVGAV